MVQAHNNHMTGLMRRARHAAEADARQLRQAAEAGLNTLIDTGEAVFAGDREESVAGLRERIGADRLAGAVMVKPPPPPTTHRGVVDAVIAHIPDLRKSLPGLLVAASSHPTPGGMICWLRSICSRRLDQGAIKALARMMFRSTLFPPVGRRHCGTIAASPRRSPWETALAVAVRDALRAGDLYLSHSRQHAGFWSLVPNERPWACSRAASRCRSRPRLEQPA